MKRAFVLALALAACQGEQAAEDDADALSRAAIGQRHPSSGPFAPVSESGWAKATWAPGAQFTSGEGSTLRVAVYSAHATAVLLEIYDAPSGRDALYDYWLRKGPDGIWRGALSRVPGKTLYAFRTFGPNWPLSGSWRRGNSAAGFVADVDAQGNRFNPNKLLFDPYARELSHDKSTLPAGETNRIYGTGGADIDAAQVYSGPSTGGRAVDRRTVDTGRYAPKSVALFDSTFTGRRPHLPAKDAAIYEAHVRGLTAHPSSAHLRELLSGFSGFEQVANIPDAQRGTYRAAGLMAPYLEALGYTTIELLPVQETDNEQDPADRPGGNYWGYMTDGFFAPDRRHAFDKGPGGPTREFKQMVAAFHAAGLEVYLDVVYNHTGEAGTWDATQKAAEITSLRGLDNASYYTLAPDRAAYWETTGCGNNLDAAQPAVRRLVLDSLAWWVSQMGVDGFRFDIATVLGRDGPGHDFNSGAQLLRDIAVFAAANDVEIVAEPWDLGTYQVGGFPAGWGEWNGRYRDAVRRYLKGDLSGSGGRTWADAFTGDFADFFAAGGPHLSINLIDAHDGFTLADLVSYDSRTNGSRSWPFGPSDGGMDQNDSWSWNFDPVLRRQAMRNFFLFQALSRGVPMHVYGDEFGRTQNGNNNPYQVDSVATWNNYGMIATDAPQRVPTGDGGERYHDNLGQDAHPDGRNDLFLFVRYVLQLRKAHPALRQADYSMPISFAKADGSAGFDGSSDLMGRVLLQGSAVADRDFLLLSNMYWQAGAFAVPPPPPGTQWVRLADTAAWAEPDSNAWAPDAAAVIGASYVVNPRSMVLLMAR